MTELNDTELQVSGGADVCISIPVGLLVHYWLGGPCWGLLIT